MHTHTHMRACTHTHAQISHTLSFLKVKGENKQMPQRRWKTGIVLIKAVKTKEGREKHKDLKEQISTAGNSKTFPISHSHLGHPSSGWWGICSFCETAYMTRVQTKGLDKKSMETHKPLKMYRSIWKRLEGSSSKCKMSIPSSETGNLNSLYFYHFYITFIYIIKYVENVLLY